MYLSGSLLISFTFVITLMIVNSRKAEPIHSRNRNGHTLDIQQLINAETIEYTVRNVHTTYTKLHFFLTSYLTHSRSTSLSHVTCVAMRGYHLQFSMISKILVY